MTRGLGRVTFRIAFEIGVLSTYRIRIHAPFVQQLGPAPKAPKAPRIVVITLFAFPALECSGSGCLVREIDRFWGD